jgi:protein-S-isoprenylcysteine O-methyltransferase Ste14
VEASSIRIHHPNREKPQSQATKAVVVLLLLASAALIAIVLIGGFSKMAGAIIVAVAYIIIYLAMAYFVSRWSRGVLPVAAALAIIFTTFAAVAAPAWFARDEPGLEDPLLPAGLLGMLTLVVLAVQILLILFAMRGFQQEWNVEVELREGEYYDRESGDTVSADERESGAERPS